MDFRKTPDRLWKRRNGIVLSHWEKFCAAAEILMIKIARISRLV